MERDDDKMDESEDVYIEFDYPSFRKQCPRFKINYYDVKLLRKNKVYRTDRTFKVYKTSVIDKTNIDILNFHMDNLSIKNELYRGEDYQRYLRNKKRNRIMLQSLPMDWALAREQTIGDIIEDGPIIPGNLGGWITGNEYVINVCYKDKKRACGMNREGFGMQFGFTETMPKHLIYGDTSLSYGLKLAFSVIKTELGISLSKWSIEPNSKQYFQITTWGDRRYHIRTIMISPNSNGLNVVDPYTFSIDTPMRSKNDTDRYKLHVILLGDKRELLKLIGVASSDERGIAGYSVVQYNECLNHWGKYHKIPKIKLKMYDQHIKPKIVLRPLNREVDLKKEKEVIQDHQMDTVDDWI